MMLKNESENYIGATRSRTEKGLVKQTRFCLSSEVQSEYQLNCSR